jgi:hypothetical protein
MNTELAFLAGLLAANLAQGEHWAIKLAILGFTWLAVRSKEDKPTKPN